jgi:proteasome lid subunit RPN8/RPN11
VHSLWLTPEQAELLIAYARAGQPNEVCGVLGGSAQGAVKLILPVANIAAQPATTYYMDERELIEALHAVAEADMELLGFYHSHPRGHAIPSPTDIRSANYPDTTTLIIGLGARKPELAAWNIRPGQVDRVELVISLSEPVPPLSAPGRAQTAALFTTAAIALILLLVISLTLLPPAPPLPSP